MTVCRPDEAWPISGDDYPFRLEVTSLARREIGPAMARVDRQEPRSSFGRGHITATLQRVANPLDCLRPHLMHSATATHGRHRLE